MVKQGFLILETGERFEGKLIGNVPDICGEVVFNTSMTGYQEIITDPSYAGQIVVFSYPLIGNYGINKEYNESPKPHVKGMVTGELCAEPNHFTATGSFINMLEKYNLPCLTEVDTRKLVKTIRKKGTVKGVISHDKTAHIPDWETENLFHQVTAKKIFTHANDGPHIILLDFGYKKSILHYLLHAKCKVTIVPYHYPLEEIHALKPDGVIISNGPGDPVTASDQLLKIRNITESYPTLGICLGHQLIALAYGAKTKKLLFGHRGGNHPVKDLETEKVFMTAQNHGYVVEDSTVDEAAFAISFKNVNDGTIEGLRHRNRPIMTVQFHPEAHPGPQDTEYIFDQFMHLLNQYSGVISYALQ